jgi:hypothetical protein
VHATPSSQYGIARLLVQEVLKGSTPEVIEFEVRAGRKPYGDGDFDPGVEAFFYSQGYHLFLLRRDRDYLYDPVLHPSRSRRAHFDLDGVISLDADLHPQDRYTSELHLLATRDEGYAYVRSLTSTIRPAIQPPRVVFLALPPATHPENTHRPVVSALFDERLEAVARTWIVSPDPWERLNGLLVLSCRRTSEHEDLIKALLHDPFWLKGSYTFRFYGRIYPLRRYAAEVLDKWAIPFERSSLAAPIAAHDCSTTKLLTCVALLLICAFAAGWLWNPARGSRIGAGSSAVSLLLLLLLGIAWAASPWRIFEYVASRGPVQWELAFTPAGLQATHLKEGSFGDYSEVVTFPNETDLRQRWDATAPVQSVKTYAPFISRFEGYTIDLPLSGKLPWVEWSMWRTPYSIPVIPLSILPTITAINALRRCRRLRSGLCVVCGYDLRSTSNRCPECGTTIERHASSTLSPATSPAYD